MVRGRLGEHVSAELAAAEAAGLGDIVRSFAAGLSRLDDAAAPAQVPTDAEIHGVDVLSFEAAVKELWKAGIFAESAMGCTGPVVKVQSRSVERSEKS